MKTDITKDALFQEAAEIAQSLLQPGTGMPVDAVEMDVTLDGTKAVVAGVVMDRLEGAKTTRICLVDMQSGVRKTLTSGPNSDRGCKFSPDGACVAFLSDRESQGDFQLCLMDLQGIETAAVPRVQGWIEYLFWSDDGTKILLGVAGHGADTSSIQGAVSSKQHQVAEPSWMPQVENGEEAFRRRSVWIYDLATNSLRQVMTSDLNIWEANWCGPSAFVAVVSTRTDEGAWYAATLAIIDIPSGKSRQIYQPNDQLGWPSASATGNQIAFVEAVCSDRGVVAGDLLLFDMGTCAISRIATNGADISSTQWLDSDRLLLGGHRGFETLVLEYSASAQELTEIWASAELGAAGRYIRPNPLGAGGCAFISEGYRMAPQIAAVEGGKYRAVHSFDTGFEATIQQWVNRVEPLTWTAPDGLEIQGWLLLPAGDGPYPLVMHVHGGPLLHWRPHWLGRAGPDIANLMLLRRGYAVFQPNPRGSTGRGQDFARMVKGDLNGADSLDLLSGLDSLVERGIADPHRIGVTGTSYGGSLAYWLVTQDQRFAAAVAIAPISDQVSLHLMSNIPEFDELFLDDNFDTPGGKHHQRSAVMHVRKVVTPTLSIAGALDRCTPPNQAVEFHNALRLQGVNSAIAIYPEEGHGIHSYPAVLDFAARVVDWFVQHMPSAIDTPSNSKL